MNSGIASLHKVLKDETRRKIILLLKEKGSLSYVDLMKALGITNTGKMNYHLKVLGDLLSKKENGEYTLSEKGILASRLLLEFPENSVSRLRLSSKAPQVLWGGIIICIFALIGLYGFSNLFFVAVASGEINVVERTFPVFLLGALFLLIGSYMIISDLKKKSNIDRKLSNLTRRALIVCILFIIVLGVALIGNANALPETVEQLDRFVWLATGTFTLIAGILSFFGFVPLEFSKGAKTGVFWWGLIIFGLALSLLFGLLWNKLVLASQLPDVDLYPASFALLLIGFLMIKRGGKKEYQTYASATQLQIYKPKSYLSQRNYRALVYLLASIIILSLSSSDFHGLLLFDYLAFNLNLIGVLFLFLFYGRPHMWGGWYDPADILPNLLLVFGLFVEIFIVCEFIISLKKLVHRINKLKPSNSSV